ncbi:diguanylate cyclase [Deinococcus taeanensis]|uniref:tetratricopeptide repeat-containing diguanylate cyclase n=1 Tax=Deinococcus taeanensis TaxID=2737050 RepID=UPI001CDCEF78|nr:GGDEF domain-containing protein [Deinococcus taeanensis]UBV42972.1 diguanylate cyclase [Deinococcus taeanensis]
MTPLDARLEDAWQRRELEPDRSRSLLQGVTPDAAGPLGAAAWLVMDGYLKFRDAQQAGALEAAASALKILEAHPASWWFSRALNVRSCALLELGEWEPALVSLRAQLSACHANGDRETEGCALHDLGVMHTRRDPPRAAVYLRAAGALFTELEHGVGQTYVAWSDGELMEALDRPAEALTLYRKALTLAERHGHHFMEVLVLSRLGELAVAQGREAEGEVWLRRALAQQNARPDRPLWVSVPPMVHLLRLSGRLTEAREVLDAQLARAQAAGMIAPQPLMHELLSEVLEQLGEPEAALKHARAHLRLVRQELAEEQERRVRGLEVLHRTELAEREAQLQRQQNEALRSALADLETLHREVERVSLTDELTGIANRHALMTRGAALAAGLTRPAAVAMVDVDHFKRVNDEYGHDGGDRALRAFAQHLAGGLGPGELVARFGGEEFVVLWPGVGVAEAQRRLEGMRRALVEVRVPGLPAALRLSFTGGVVPLLGGDLLGALRRADELLLRGKRQGRAAVLADVAGT